MIGRIKVLDTLRGFAAIVVLLFHYSKYWNKESVLFTIFKYGYTGVILFFMISGFVIFLSINKISDANTFLFKRFSRLYPTFWVCLIFTSLVVRICGLKDREVGWVDTIFNFTMIPKVFGYESVDGVYWTLSCEFFFYLLMAIILKMKIIKNVFLWLVPWLILCLIQNFIYELPKSIVFILNLKYGFYFIAGILFYKLKKDDTTTMLNHFFIFICMFSGFYSCKDFNEGSFVIFYFILFYLFSFEKINWFSNKTFLFFGTISYPLYLLHQNIGYVIITQLKRYSAEIYLLVIPSLLSILLAFVVHKYVELPVMKRLKKNKDK